MGIGTWLASLTAKDIMTTKVVTLRPNDTLARAADLLLREQVTGAPVTDEDNVCLGVLSASDFLSADEKVDLEREKIANSSFFNSNLALPMRVYSEKLQRVSDKLAPAAEQPIDRFMTKNVVHVSEDTPVSVIVHDMVEAHIHRVVVVDANRVLKGLVSTIDVLAALMKQGSQNEAADDVCNSPT